MRLRILQVHRILKIKLLIRSYDIKFEFVLVLYICAMCRDSNIFENFDASMFYKISLILHRCIRYIALNTSIANNVSFSNVHYIMFNLYYHTPIAIYFDVIKCLT